MNSLLSTSDNDLTPNGEDIVMKDSNESSAKTYRVRRYMRSSLGRQFMEHLTCTLLATTVIIVGLITLIVITSAILKYQIYFSDALALKNALANSSDVPMPPSEIATSSSSSSNDTERRRTWAHENYPREKEGEEVGLDARSWLNFTEKVVFNDNNNLWLFDAKNETLSVLHEAGNGIDAFEIVAGRSIFLASFNGTFTTIAALDREANSTDKTTYNHTTIFEETRVRVKAMAYDRIAENLYVIDESKGTLIVIDALRTRDYNVLLSDLIQPSKILLDPAKGVMFVLQMSHSIIKADMNGENLSAIVEKHGISGLTVDQRHERVYWVNDVVGIESCDYEGKQPRYFHTDTATIIDLSVWNDRLYWLWQDHHRQSKHQVVFCRVDGDICQDYLMQPLSNLENPTAIEVVSEMDDNDKDNKKNPSNPCRVNRGRCEQLCLVIPRGRHSCACKLGWQLNPDKRTCRESRDFVLYATESTIRGRTLDVTRKVLVDVILPTPYYLQSLKSSIVFDYDRRHDNLYFSDGKNVFRMQLRAYRNQTSLLEYNENVITDLAYDWLSGNLYVSEYVDQQMYYSTVGITYLIKLLDVKQDTVTRQVELKSFTNGYTRHSSFCIHPSRHYVFYIATLGYTQSIYRLSTLANSTMAFGALQDAVPRLARPMAIDYSENRLYWIYASDQLTRIDHANLDGTDTRSIVVDGVAAPSYIFVYREWIFLASASSVWRVKKRDGKNVVTMVSRKSYGDEGVIYDARLISDAVQSASR